MSSFPFVVAMVALPSAMSLLAFFAEYKHDGVLESPYMLILGAILVYFLSSEAAVNISESVTLENMDSQNQLILLRFLSLIGSMASFYGLANKCQFSGAQSQRGLTRNALVVLFLCVDVTKTSFHDVRTDSWLSFMVSHKEARLYLIASFLAVGIFSSWSTLLKFLNLTSVSEDQPDHSLSSRFQLFTIYFFVLKCYIGFRVLSTESYAAFQIYYDTLLSVSFCVINTYLSIVKMRIRIRSVEVT